MGRYLLDLADVIRAAGLTVVEVPGWRTRGWRGGSTPDGGMLGILGGLAHHTGTSAKAPGDYPSLAIVRDGRGGTSPVPGPLAQLGLGRSGTVYVIAAGRANHSGAVDDVRYSNPYALGIEAENPGDGTPWPVAQYAAYVVLCRALQAHYHLLPWRGHKEAAVPAGRKIDPTFDMQAFRRAVAATPTTPAPPEEDDMPTAPEIATALLNSPAYDGGPTVSEVLKALDRQWTDVTVTRGDTKVPVLQEIADAKTAAEATRAALDGATLETGNPAALADAITARIVEKVGPGIGDAVVGTLIARLEG